MRASHPIESTMLPAKIASLSVVALLTCAALGVAHCAAADSADEDKLVRAAEVLHEFTADEEKSIPLDLLQRARGVAVIPTLIRGGIFIGGRRGRGVLTVRAASGEWSNPSFITLTGGNIGL